MYYLGTDLKFIVDPTAPGFDKNRDDWEVTVSRGPDKERTFTKEELAKDENDNYYLCFSSVEFGTGQYYITVTTHTPDEDFNDGLRDEVWQSVLCKVEKMKK